MFLNRTIFVLAFTSTLWVLTVMWGNQGLMIDPDGKPAAATAPTHGGAGPLSESGLMIDPDGAK